MSETYILLGVMVLGSVVVAWLSVHYVVNVCTRYDADSSGAPVPVALPEWARATALGSAGRDPRVGGSIARVVPSRSEWLGVSGTAAVVEEDGTITFIPGLRVWV